MTNTHWAILMLSMIAMFTAHAISSEERANKILDRIEQRCGR